MKKIALCSVVVSMALSMTSCKKDRTCTCITSDSTGGPSTTTTIVVTKATKKSVAAGVCASTVETVKSGGQAYTVNKTCTMK